MNKLWTLAVALLLALPSIAQNSGYMGKHFSLNYSLYTSNAFRGPSEHGGNGFFSFNTNHHFSLDAAVARRLSLGVSFEYVHTKFNFDKTFTDSYSYYDGSTLINDNLTFKSKSQGNIEVYGLTIYPKIFTRQSLAPLGSYFKPEIIIQFFKVTYGPLKYTSAPAAYPGPDFSNHSPYINVMLGLEVGQNRILWNRMFIDYGFRLAFKPWPGGYSTGALSERNYLEEVPKQRLVRHFLFNVKAGVGVLLF